MCVGFEPASVQVDPLSIAAEDGRIREGDQIIQVMVLHIIYNH